jgi:hypothetical protein
MSPAHGAGGRVKGGPRQGRSAGPRSALEAAATTADSRLGAGARPRRRRRGRSAVPAIPVQADSVMRLPSSGCRRDRVWVACRPGVGSPGGAAEAIDLHRRTHLGASLWSFVGALVAGSAAKEQQHRACPRAEPACGPARSRHAARSQRTKRLCERARSCPGLLRQPYRRYQSVSVAGWPQARDRGEAAAPRARR